VTLHQRVFYDTFLHDEVTQVVFGVDQVSPLYIKLYTNDGAYWWPEHAMLPKHLANGEKENTI